MKQNKHGPQCNYYWVTWDPRYPRGCKLFGFRGTAMPSIMVYKATGAKCQNYSSRQIQSNKA
jgi:hypothetical protein